MKRATARTAGFVVHVVIGGVMILLGVTKAFLLIPGGGMAAVIRLGLEQDIRMVGIGEVITAVLLLVPRTLPFGVWMMSAYWGGAICIHMGHKPDSYLLESTILVASWLGAYLRAPWTLLGPSVRTNAVPSTSKPGVDAPETRA